MHFKNLFLAALILFFTALMLLQSSATAATADLFFSEYIEGSSNNKALEIYNGTGAQVDLALGGYKVEMYFNGAGTPGLTINLTGAVANGDVFVLGHSSADPAILAQADQTYGSGWYNGDDAVILRKGSTVVDAIGQIAFDPGAEWGSGLVSTGDNTLSRKESICAGDTDETNVFDPSSEWDGFATNTFSGLGSHIANCGSNNVERIPALGEYGLIFLALFLILASFYHLKRNRTNSIK